MLTTIKQYWKKEYWLVVVIILCLVLLAYREKLSEKKVNEWIQILPTIGGVFFGLNTLVQIAK